jgi:hypothetical protein
MFRIPTLTQDDWSVHNQKVNALMGPLHFDIASENTTPAAASTQFVTILTDFLSSNSEFLNDETKSKTKYVEHEESALKRTRTLKNSLRKKAFAKNADPKDKKAFKKALKAYNFLKKADSKKKQSKSVQHQENLYRRNFWTFAGQCAKGTLGKDPISPAFDAQLANQYYPNKYGTANPVALDRLKWFPYLSTTNLSDSFNMDAIRPRDLRKMLSKTTATSAPGPDNLMYGFLKKLPATHHILATLFSKLLISGDPPEDWSKSTVSLIFKSGDMDNPANFRMISLTSCVGKLFHQIVADRIEKYMISNNLLDPQTQKAFLKGINGCIEHTTVMGELLADAKARKRTLYVTFFDLADAFGSVEHNLIDFALRRNGVPKPICDYVLNLYSRLQGRVKTKSWTSEPFNFRRGVFQRDPLSPIIFLVVFQSFSTSS